MKKIIGLRAYVASIVVLGLCAFGASASDMGSSDDATKNGTSASVQTPESAIQNWPERPRSTARALIAKYGTPSRFDDNGLVWYQNGPWKKTVVYRKAPEGFMHGRDVLEQSIAYNVPDGKLPDLKSFDSRIKFDKATGELSSLSESEALNFLALNLADEIVADKRSPDEARDFYHKTMKLTEAGKSSAYSDGFVFTVGETKTQTLNGESNPAEAPYQSGIPERTETPNQSATIPNP